MKQNCKCLESCVSKGIMCLKKQYVTHLAELQYQYHWKDLEAVEKPQHLPTASKALTASPGTLTHRCTQTWDTISSQLWGYRISPNNAVKAPVCSPALVPWIYPPALWFGLPSSVPDFFSFCSQVRSWTWFMLGLLIDPVTCTQLCPCVQSLHDFPPPSSGNGLHGASTGSQIPILSVPHFSLVHHS